MCLIAYSPKGLMVDRSILAYAYNKNPDGIGIMSGAGIEKYMGAKALKRARRYLETYIVPKKVPFAIHFRWATHGDIKMENTHPYAAPTGQHWVMHNGIINCTADEATPDESDTAVFVRKYMADAPALDHATYFTSLATKVGWGNKLCIMNDLGEFVLCNASAGDWIDGIWFSNTYSLPAHKVPKQTHWANGYDGYYQNRGCSYIPREIWDTDTRKMIPNPAYKEADPKPTETATVIHLLPRNGTRWNNDDRRSYYEALEAGLTVQEAEQYNDEGTTVESDPGERAALNKALDEVEAAAIRQAETEKETADIGGDFAGPETDEDQSKFRQYLKRVAAGIFVS